MGIRTAKKTNWNDCKNGLTIFGVANYLIINLHNVLNEKLGNLLQI